VARTIITRDVGVTNHIMQNARIFVLHFQLVQHTLAPKATALGEITQNGHYAVQSHSRSWLSVPIESPYATLYYCI